MLLVNIFRTKNGKTRHYTASEINAKLCMEKDRLRSTEIVFFFYNMIL